MSVSAVFGSDPYDLSDVEVLLVNPDEKIMSVMLQVFTGFGVRRSHACATAEKAMEMVASKNFGLIVSEIDLPGADGFSLVRDLRRCAHEPNRFQPVLLMTHQARHADVLRGRDCGANLVITRPIVPEVILQRIFWLRREPRPWVECESYVGPDRRYHNLGPPPGMSGRRADDLSAHLGEASTPNLSQNDIDSLFKARIAS
jgi:DNA-binding response OmpR family regulator